MSGVFALVHLEAISSPYQDEPKPPCQLWPQRMGGGAAIGGTVVGAGLSRGKCATISGSVSNRSMKRRFGSSSLPNASRDDRSGLSAGTLFQMEPEPCCNVQDGGTDLQEQSLGGAPHSSLHRPKRERKQRTYTLCEVCNIQLNSAAQAQIHYNGKSHQKRLKQISNGKMPSSTAHYVMAAPTLRKGRQTNQANTRRSVEHEA
ncbi:unnamed protein product [Menidia menidia]|uniref:(Atlantic silverside) hypothetical protein n=1 Tax=Menidia menidia TaxID=238744 RepID=A0A8S4AVX0_9TELE|nr:unnamed protein product [Menidia menidia]